MGPIHPAGPDGWAFEMMVSPILKLHPNDPSFLGAPLSLHGLLSSTIQSFLASDPAYPPILPADECYNLALAISSTHPSGDIDPMLLDKVWRDGPSLPTPAFAEWLDEGMPRAGIQSIRLSLHQTKPPATRKRAPSSQAPRDPGRQWENTAGQTWDNAQWSAPTAPAGTVWPVNPLWIPAPGWSHLVGSTGVYAPFPYDPTQLARPPPGQPDDPPTAWTGAAPGSSWSKLFFLGHVHH